MKCNVQKTWWWDETIYTCQQQLNYLTLQYAQCEIIAADVQLDILNNFPLYFNTGTWHSIVVYQFSLYRHTDLKSPLLYRTFYYKTGWLTAGNNLLMGTLRLNVAGVLAFRGHDGVILLHASVLLNDIHVPLISPWRVFLSLSILWSANDTG